MGRLSIGGMGGRIMLLHFRALRLLEFMN